MGDTISREDVEAWMATQELKARTALERRIVALEKQCAVLAAEVDRTRPVVEAAVEWRRYGYERKADFYVGITPLLDAIDIYDVGEKRPCEEL